MRSGSSISSGRWVLRAPSMPTAADPVEAEGAERRAGGPSRAGTSLVHGLDAQRIDRGAPRARPGAFR